MRCIHFQVRMSFIFILKTILKNPARNQFEYDLQMDLIGKAIKQTRQERNLTQEELGKLIGVQKAQISRLENNASNVTMETLLRVFKALKAKVKLSIELPNIEIKVGQ